MKLLDFFKGRRYLVVGVFIVIFLVILVVWLRASQSSANVISKDEKNKTKGFDDAQIQIIEYSDFQCPACKKVEPYIQKMFETYPGKIRFAYRHFPLSGHKWAQPAHQAAECAATVNRFWDYHDKLYNEQEKWTVMPNPPEAFIQYAKDLGMNVDKFTACMQDQKITKAVGTEKDQGISQQVHSTPTFFVNGKRFVGMIEMQMQGEPFIRQVLGLPPLPPSAVQSVVGQPPQPAQPAGPLNSAATLQPPSALPQTNATTSPSANVPVVNPEQKVTPAAAQTAPANIPGQSSSNTASPIGGQPAAATVSPQAASGLQAAAVPGQSPYKTEVDPKTGQKVVVVYPMPGGSYQEPISSEPQASAGSQTKKQ